MKGAQHHQPRRHQGTFKVGVQPRLQPAFRGRGFHDSCQKAAHGHQGILRKLLPWCIPHAHRVFHPSPAERVMRPSCRPMGDVGMFLRHIRDLVFATVCIEDALGAQHAQPHIEVPGIGPKERRQFIHIPSRLEHLLQHAAMVQHRNHATEGQAIEVREQVGAPGALDLFGGNVECSHAFQIVEFQRDFFVRTASRCIVTAIVLALK